MNAELELEYDEVERAQLALDLQELVIETGLDLKKKPTCEDMADRLGEGNSTDFFGFRQMTDIAFEDGFNGLLRSLGDIPHKNRTPQDKFQKIQLSEEEFPIKKEYAREQSITTLNNFEAHFGSYSGAMEALGVFDGYFEMLSEDVPRQSVAYLAGTRKRAEDHRSLEASVESTLSKEYDEMSFKYSID